MTAPIDVAAALIFRDGRLLLAQRPVGSHLGGLWEFPGGKREADESWEACLRRELAEELGPDLEVELGPLFEEVTHAYPEKTVHLRFYLCRWRRGEPQPLGCAGVCWVERDELSRHEFPAADARLLERLQREPVGW